MTGVRYRVLIVREKQYREFPRKLTSSRRSPHVGQNCRTYCPKLHSTTDQYVTMKIRNPRIPERWTGPRKLRTPRRSTHSVKFQNFKSTARGSRDLKWNEHHLQECKSLPVKSGYTARERESRDICEVSRPWSGSVLARRLGDNLKLFCRTWKNLRGAWPERWYLYDMLIGKSYMLLFAANAHPIRECKYVTIEINMPLS